MNMYDIITKKKQNKELTKEEILYFVKGYTEGHIPDYQIASLLMAICLNGMTDEETVALTDAITKSGDTVDLSAFGELSADKHSTGGVGDKTTLIVAPIAASLGCKMAKMSGRGLGHTGGTVDKLEAFSGYKTQLSPEEFLSQVQNIGIAVIGQSGNLAPADKKLYALRDVTATVDSIPLIVSSIMGKKLAAGSKNIVLDVKYGSGAFMKSPEDAELLAENMVKIGKKCGRNISAVITDMDTPLGYAIGNSLEVVEAIETLQGRGPADLREVCISLSSEIVRLTLNVSEEKSREMVVNALDSGLAYNKFCQWIEFQSGSIEYIKNPELFKKSEFQIDVFAEKDGYIEKMDTEALGLVALSLGAGRATKDDTIDHSAGIVLTKKTGEFVRVGEKLATLYTGKRQVLNSAKESFAKAIHISSKKKSANPLIHKKII